MRPISPLEFQRKHDQAIHCPLNCELVNKALPRQQATGGPIAVHHGQHWWSTGPLIYITLFWLNKIDIWCGGEYCSCENGDPLRGTTHVTVSVLWLVIRLELFDDLKALIAWCSLEFSPATTCRTCLFWRWLFSDRLNLERIGGSLFDLLCLFRNLASRGYSNHGASCSCGETLRSWDDTLISGATEVIMHQDLVSCVGTWKCHVIC